MNRTSGRRRYETLAARRPDIHLTVVSPDRWWEYGAAMPVDPPVGPLDFRVQPIRWLRVPLAVWNCHHYVDLGRVIQQIQPDVIHLWEEPWSFVALQATRLRAKLAPQAALLLETDQNILRSLPPPFEQIRRYTLRKTDLLVARQTAALDVSRACGFTGPSANVEYGVDATIFAPRDRDEARRELGGDAFTIGYVGRVIPEKGLDTAIDALARCDMRVCLVIVGTGPAEDELRDQSQRLGVADRVRFLGSKSPAAVARIINGLDCLILLSKTMRTWKEQFGRVIMEAHACGIPVIGSSSGSIPSVVGAGGWVIPEGDATAAADLLQSLARSPEMVRRSGEAGLEQARTRFAIETVAETLADAYQTAAEARRVSA